MSWFEKLVGKAVGRSDAKAEEKPSPELSPQAVAILLDRWLEQVSSLKQLRMHDHAYRLMNSARGITLRSMQADPSDPMPWVNIGRVQLADENFAEAKKVLDHAIDLAQKSGNKDVEGFAGAALFQVQRLQGSTGDEVVDTKKPLTQAEYRAFQRQTLEQIFYVCQSCGHLNLMVGEHCCYCQFAPQNLTDAKLSMTLTTMYFRVPTMLGIALEIQRGNKPHEFIEGLSTILNSIESDQGILEKIQRGEEDDHLDFKAIDHCPSCDKRIWASTADACPHCHATLGRPALQKLAICVDRILQQFVWTARRSDSKEFEQFIILLVNMKYSLVRAQMGPTDAQRHMATELIIKLSPLYTQNGGGAVWVKNADKVISEVIDPSVHEHLEATINAFRDELRHFLHLMSDAVSLF